MTTAGDEVLITAVCFGNRDGIMTGETTLTFKPNPKTNGAGKYFKLNGSRANDFNEMMLSLFVDKELDLKMRVGILSTGERYYTMTFTTNTDMARNIYTFLSERGFTDGTGVDTAVKNNGKAT